MNPGDLGGRKGLGERAPPGAEPILECPLTGAGESAFFSSKKAMSSPARRGGANSVRSPVGSVEERVWPEGPPTIDLLKPSVTVAELIGRGAEVEGKASEVGRESCSVLSVMVLSLIRSAAL